MLLLFLLNPETQIMKLKKNERNWKETFCRGTTKAGREKKMRGGGYTEREKETKERIKSE